MRRNKKYSDELKKQVVEEYLSGTGMKFLVRKYELSSKKRIQVWRDQYLQYGGFPDGRGKARGGGRPHKVDISQMSQDEYIAYLEMENDILKQLRSLNSNPQK